MVVVLENIIEIKNLKFGYNIPLFDSLNLTIQKGSFITILGKNGCGKSTLAHLLYGKLPYEGQIIINRLKINEDNKNRIQKNICFITEKMEYEEDSPYQNIVYYLKKQRKTEKEIVDTVSFIEKKLKIKEVIHCSFSSLSESEKQIVAFISIILKKPKIIILDNATSKLSELQRTTIFKFLKQLKQTTIINITNNIEDSLYGDRIVLLNNQTVFLDDTTKNSLKNEKAFRSCNLDLPFMASLSLKLKYYDLLDSTILDMNKMVNKLWK